MIEQLEQAIRQAEPWEYWAWTAFLAAATVACLLLFRLNLRRVRIMRDTPTSLIRSAAQGYVELDGIGDCIADRPVASPLTRSRCTWYDYRVERRERVVQGGKRRTRWRTLRSGSSRDPFLLVDETGRCEVQPDGAIVAPSVRRVWYGSTEQPQGPGPKGSQALGFGRFRYTERLMLPGDRLYALGWFVTDGDAGRGRVGGGGTVPPRNRLVRPPAGERPFLLSTVPEASLLGRYRLYVALALAGFMTAITVVTWLWVARQHDPHPDDRPLADRGDPSPAMAVAPGRDDAAVGGRTQLVNANPVGLWRGRRMLKYGTDR